MASPAEELQRAVWSVLAAALAPVPVFDRVPETAAKPYVSFGPEYAIGDYDDGIDGFEITLQIDIWTVSVGRLECKELMESVRKTLRGASLTLTTHAVVDGRMELTRLTAESDGLTCHGVVQWSFQAEAH
jgi:hypothetical protein